MGTTITVPGANGTTVSNTFNGAANTTLAQSIATTLNALLGSGALTVASVAGGGTAPAPSRIGVNELEITTGGIVSVPAGYAFLVDGTKHANLTVTGGTSGTSFFGGGGNILYTSAGTGAASIVAGNGNDTFNLSGRYTVAAGHGFDRYNLSGTGQVSLGGGSNLITITGGADTIFAGANPGLTEISGGKGSVFFHGGDSATQVLSVITGGTGGDTIVGGANNIVFYESPMAGGASKPGAHLLAGDGNETLFGALSHTNDSFYGSFTGGNDLLVAGSGNDKLFAGTGNDSLIGGSGHDTFSVINTELLSSITKTTVTPGVDFIYNVHAGDRLGLTDYDTLYGGAPGSNTAAKAVAASLAGGASGVTLKDGTQITFVGGSNGIKVFSS